MTADSHSSTNEQTTRTTRHDQRAMPAVRGVLLLAAFLAFGVIGWEHIYHSSLIGVVDEDGAGRHIGHVFRDVLLAFPVAVVAVVAGLRAGRRYGPIVRAGFVSAAFGLLLVPSVRLHDIVDDGLSGETAHAHDQHHAAQGGVEASTGFFGMLLHGLRDAAVAEIALVPLTLVGVLLLERATSGRRRRRWSPATAVAPVAAVLAFAFGGIGLASDTGATQSRAAVVHTFQLTDNPGNWFDSGTSIAGTRSLIVARPGDTIRFEVGAQTDTVHTASSLLYPTGAAHMPFDQPHAYKGGAEEVRVTTPGLYVFLCKLHPFM